MNMNVQLYQLLGYFVYLSYGSKRPAMAGQGGVALSLMDATASVWIFSSGSEGLWGYWNKQPLVSESADLHGTPFS